MQLLSHCNAFLRNNSPRVHCKSLSPPTWLSLWRSNNRTRDNLAFEHSLTAFTRKDRMPRGPKTPFWQDIGLFIRCFPPGGQNTIRAKSFPVPRSSKIMKALFWWWAWWQCNFKVYHCSQIEMLQISFAMPLSIGLITILLNSVLTFYTIFVTCM